MKWLSWSYVNESDAASNVAFPQAHEHYQTCGPGKAVRGSKEKMVYLRERKALKTIGIVVLG